MQKHLLFPSTKHGTKPPKIARKFPPHAELQPRVQILEAELREAQDRCAELKAQMDAARITYTNNKRGWEDTCDELQSRLDRRTSQCQKLMEIIKHNMYDLQASGAVPTAFLDVDEAVEEALRAIGICARKTCSRK